MRFFIILILSIFCCIISYKGNAYNFSERVYLSSVFIQIFSLVILFSRRKMPYSLNKAFYMFSLFFFGIAPILQFYSETSFFGARKLLEREYFLMNLLIIVIMLIYELFYTIFFYKKLSKDKIKSMTKYEVDQHLTIFQTTLLIVISIVSFCFMFYANSGSILSMLVRGGEFKEESASSSSSINLIVYQFCRPLSIICLFYYIISKNRNYLVMLVLTILALITCSPIGMPRFAAAALYIPLLLLTLRTFTYSPYKFSLTFILGLLVVFPFLNIFRLFGDATEVDLSLNFDTFLTGNYDSYQNFALIVFEDIITWGKQLLAVILFWVPRTYWPDKPIGSGATVGEILHFNWTNVSANYFGEGYINFGFPGIAIFTFLLSYFTARMDNLYWTLIFNSKRNFFRVIYFIMIGMLFFILRGDLLSSFAYTMGVIFACFTVFKIVSFKIKRRALHHQ